MATTTFKVATYKISLGYAMSGGGGGPESRGYVACQSTDGQRFVIYFAAPGSAMAPPRYFPDSKFGSINVPVDEMQNYVDLVRNEKPLFVYMNSDKPEWNSVSTSQEPPGEEES